MKKPVLILILVVILAAGGGVLFGPRLRPKRDQHLQLYGNVDIREVSLGFRVGGRISEVLRDEGDAVKAGEIVARLDAEPYRREVQEARSQVAGLKARVALLESGSRPQEIAQARAVVRERQVTLENATRIYKRQQELLASNTVSTQERDDAEAKYHEAEARLKSGEEQLKLLEAGFRPEEISQAKADLQRAEAALSAAELRLQDTDLKTPSDGVVFTRAREPGAVVPSGATILTVSLASPVWVRAYVHEPDLGRIHPGMKVRVFTDSRPNQPYDAQIGYVSPQAEFTPKNVETTELRTSLVYRIRVVLDKPDQGLRQGMPVTVKML